LNLAESLIDVLVIGQKNLDEMLFLIGGVGDLINFFFNRS